jgi:hypothetical protein
MSPVLPVYPAQELQEGNSGDSIQQLTSRGPRVGPVQDIDLAIKSMGSLLDFTLPAARNLKGREFFQVTRSMAWERYLPARGWRASRPPTGRLARDFLEINGWPEDARRQSKGRWPSGDRSWLRWQSFAPAMWPFGNSIPGSSLALCPKPASATCGLAPLRKSATISESGRLTR